SWDSITEQGNGTVTIESNELVVNLPEQTDAGIAGQAYLAYSFKSVLSRIHAQFHLRMDRLESGSVQIMPLGFQLPNGQGNFLVYFLVRPTGVVFVAQTLPVTDGGTPDFVPHDVASALTFGGDHFVDVLLKLDSPSQSTVTIDGVLVSVSEPPAFF